MGKKYKIIITKRPNNRIICVKKDLSENQINNIVNNLIDSGYYQILNYKIEKM